MMAEDKTKCARCGDRVEPGDELCTECLTDQFDEQRLEDGLYKKRQVNE